MNTRLFLSTDRGKADYGWLKANYSFSFANYYNEEKVNFGVLRVLNDDVVAAGMGFGTHPHDNMEIITIPLEGALKHRDSLGNEGVIKFGEVQVMSAGTGVEHSELNASRTEQVKVLQLWIIPQIQNVEPRYDQRSFDVENNINSLITVVSPYDKPQGDALWIYQQAYISIGIFDEGKDVTYNIKNPGNGVYLFLIDGAIAADNQTLSAKDAMGIKGAEKFEFTVKKRSKVLLIDVPMMLN